MLEITDKLDSGPSTINAAPGLSEAKVITHFHSASTVPVKREKLIMLVMADVTRPV